MPTTELSVVSKVQELIGLILSGEANNDATSYPFWGISRTFRGEEILLNSGIWFNRADAEAHLKNKSHRYPKVAHVYCFSGHDSWHVKEMYRLVKEIRDSLAESEAK